jgi:hypothetical protein
MLGALILPDEPPEIALTLSGEKEPRSSFAE